jgi:hypothetical protein
MKYLEFVAKQISTGAKIKVSFIDVELDTFIHAKEDHLVFCSPLTSSNGFLIKKSDIEFLSAHVNEKSHY